ncbi:MAG: DUF1257 domain-containing protein [Nitrospinota bacterium]
MSHFTQIQTKITDLNCLKTALEDIGFSYREGDIKVKGWRGKTEKVELVVNTGSMYGIGFKRNEDGFYEVVADWWGVQSRTGIKQRTFINRLNQRYAYHKVLTEAKNKGFTVAEDEVMEDKTIKLVVRKWQ